jgi:hypothetical protein
MLFKGKLNLRNSVFSCFKKVLFLLSLLLFSMDGVGQHQTTALAEEGLVVVGI